MFKIKSSVCQTLAPACGALVSFQADFDEIHTQVEQERQIKEETERKLEQARIDKLEKVEKEMQGRC